MALADELRAALEHEPGVVTALLDGSEARGTSHADSDVDLAVVLDDPSWEARADMETRLCLALHRDVHLVDFERIPADLAFRVIRDGVLLVDRDRARRVALTVRHWKVYWDMTPAWRMIRRLPPGMFP